MKRHGPSGIIIGAGFLITTQYILAFFVYKLPGIIFLQGLGWLIWAISLFLGFAPIIILRQKGSVTRGKSFVHTTKLVKTGLYAFIRHPQYLALILFSLSLMLLAQHWLVMLLDILVSMIMYFELRAADKEGIEKFGDAYRIYMLEVPQINILLGLFRYLNQRKK